MSQLRVLNTSIFLFFVFIIQETVIARIHFPFNGFSLYIAALMVLLSLEDRAGSLVFGFIGGLVMDLSTSAVTFLLIGVLLGQENGPFLRNILLILANTFWTFLIIPIFLPVIIRIRKMLLTNRERV